MLSAWAHVSPTRAASRILPLMRGQFFDQIRDHPPRAVVFHTNGNSARINQLINPHRLGFGGRQHLVWRTLVGHVRHLPRETDLDVLKNVAATLSAAAMAGVVLLTRGDLRALRNSLHCPEHPDMAALWHAPSGSLSQADAQQLAAHLGVQGVVIATDALRELRHPAPQGHTLWATEFPAGAAFDPDAPEEEEPDYHPLRGAQLLNKYPSRPITRGQSEPVTALLHVIARAEGAGPWRQLSDRQVLGLCAAQSAFHTGGPPVQRLPYQQLKRSSDASISAVHLYGDELITEQDRAFTLNIETRLKTAKQSVAAAKRALKAAEQQLAVTQQEWQDAQDS